MSIGLDEDLDDAAKQAVREMIKHVCARTNFTRNEAYICALSRVTSVDAACRRQQGNPHAFAEIAFVGCSRDA